MHTGKPFNTEWCYKQAHDGIIKLFKYTDIDFI